MSAVDVLKLAAFVQFHHQQGCVLLADNLVVDVQVQSLCNLFQRQSLQQLRINCALQYGASSAAETPLPDTSATTTATLSSRRITS